ncbi:MAG: MlaA family lipoprotein [Thiomonas sp.]
MAAGTGVFLAYGPTAQVSPPSASYGALALNLVNTRANLLDASNLFDQISLDPYVFTRSAYEQRRKSQVEEVRDRPFIDLGEPNPLAKYSYGPENEGIPGTAPARPAVAASTPKTGDAAP